MGVAVFSEADGFFHRPFFMIRFREWGIRR